MKRLNLYVLIVLAIAVTSQMQIAIGQTVSITENPNWTTDNDWSLSAPVVNDNSVQDAVLNHNSTIDFPFSISDSIVISSGVTFVTHDKIVVEPGGELQIMGEVMLTTETIKLLPGGVIHIYSGGQLTGMADVQLKELSGEFILDEGGIIEWAGDWKLNGGSGTAMTLNGQVTIDGDLDNKIDINGSGSITLGGILNNFPNASIFGCSLPGDECCLGQTPCILGGAVPLPVELLSYRVTLIRDVVEIEWSTASETNNDGYFIERSTDAISWNQIAQIDANASVTGIINYRIMDAQPIKGLSYYRLSQKDADGTISNLAIEAISYSTNSFHLNIYPNPARNQVFVSIGDLDNARLSIIDHLGRRVLEKAIERDQFELDVSQFPAGFYVVELRNGSNIETKKLIIH